MLIAELRLRDVFKNRQKFCKRTMKVKSEENNEETPYQMRIWYGVIAR